MQNGVHGFRAHVAALTALSLLLSPAAPLVNAQAAARPASQTSSAKPLPPVTAPAPVDGGWPRTYTTPSGATLVLYQPQVESWAQQKHAVLYAAVSYAPSGASKPVVGTVRMEADTDVSVAERLVSISGFQITEPNFPALPKDQMRDLVAEISTSVPRDERVIALDRMLAALDKSQIIPKNVDGVKADPPVVFFSKTPAVLVNLDGDPIWSPIAGNDLEYAVNTNWDLFRHGPMKTFFLRATDTWMKAPAIDGPWTYAGRLPASFFKLPNDGNFADAKGALPGKRIAASQAPKVFESSTPAEIILLRGEPTYLVVDGAQQLLWVSNTDADGSRGRREAVRSFGGGGGFGGGWGRRRR